MTGHDQNDKRGAIAALFAVSMACIGIIAAIAMLAYAIAGG